MRLAVLVAFFLAFALLLFGAPAPDNTVAGCGGGKTGSAFTLPEAYAGDMWEPC